MRCEAALCGAGARHIVVWKPAVKVKAARAFNGKLIINDLRERRNRVCEGHALVIQQEAMKRWESVVILPMWAEQGR